MMHCWLVTTSFSGERKSKMIINPCRVLSPTTRTLPSTEILAPSRTALVSRIWTSADFPGFCCAVAANVARHSSTMGENLIGPSVAGLDTVPFCSGFTPTNGQVLEYTTGLSPNPCYTAVASSGGTIATTTSTLRGDNAGNAVAVTGTGTNCV